jgi:riboflavin biosynthesis pyrimidine reductase
MNRAKRPYVICHMVPSVDGRIVTASWKLPLSVLAEYERTARTFHSTPMRG